MSNLIYDLWASYSPAYRAIKRDDELSLDNCISCSNYHLRMKNLLTDAFDIHYLTGYKLLEMIVKFDAVRCMSLMMQKYKYIIRPPLINEVLKHDSYRILNYFIENDIDIVDNALMTALRNDSSYCLELMYSKCLVDASMIWSMKDLLLTTVACYGFWLSVVKPTISKPRSRL